MRTRLLLGQLIFTSLATAATQTHAAPEPADSVYRNGRIYTVDETRSWAEAVAIKSGKFEAVGSNDEIAKHVGPRTRVVDLDGRMAMPGIHDMHEHPVEGGFQHLFECSFPFSTPLDGITANVQKCADKAKKGEWIRGGQWAAESLDSEQPPTREMLDAVAPDNPVFLIDSTYHNAWVNTRALALLGIEASTPNPNGGVIVRDAKTGAATGILFDNAAYGAMKRLPLRTDAQYRQAILWTVAKINALGITAIKDALADGHSVDAYTALDREGKLDLRVATSRPWRASWTESDTDETRNLERWMDGQTPNVRTGYAKIFVDGIPPTRTAAMLEPYLPDKVHGAGFKGELQHSPADLNAALIRLDKLGMTVKMHATGDASLRAGLDAIEAARNANGNTKLRHEIAHAELANPVDIPRFKSLNAIAELSPVLWYPTPLVEFMATVIGRERANQFWPIKTMLDAGVLMVYGSDWPSVVPSPNPWPGIEAMVTRRDPHGVLPGALAPEQAISLADAIDIVTRNGSIAMQLDNETGSIEPGKSADLIILDRNLFEIPAKQISDTVVLETVFAGRVVSAQRLH